MLREIKELDWRLFRQLQEVALQRFCARVLEEAGRIISDASKSYHDRYGDLYRLIHDRDRELAQAFDNPRRSTALIQICALRSRELLTDEEFARFSEDTRGAVGRVLGLHRE